ncbi:hypothetical protein HYX05_03425 [Candidatus Woesearchaeota archaeon]|nr:hypothetical protein [Candidatus Woesearchaeota archaeon]
MTQSTDYGRRNFLYNLLVAGAATALPKQFSPLEATAAEAGKKFQSVKRPDGPSEIAELILQNINKLNRFHKNGNSVSPLVYRDVSADYALAAESARKNSTSSDADKSGEYKGLEVVALMWQAELLRNKVRVNIVTDETIQIAGLPKINAKRNLGDAYIGDNLFKALQNYERVAVILQKHGQNLPNEVGIGILGEYGTIATPYWVYYRMNQTITKLLETADKRYHSALQKKKKKVDQQLERLKLASFKASG